MVSTVRAIVRVPRYPGSRAERVRIGRPARPSGDLPAVEKTAGTVTTAPCPASPVIIVESLTAKDMP